MCFAKGPQRSDAGEVRTRDLSVSSQALYHWATALPRITKAQTSLSIRAVWSAPLLFAYWPESIISRLATREISIFQLVSVVE